MADGSTHNHKTFAHKSNAIVPVNVPTRRLIRVTKVSGGRSVEVFVNGVQAGAAQTFGVHGDIYTKDGDGMKVGYVYGWEFIGTVHNITLRGYCDAVGDGTVQTYYGLYHDLHRLREVKLKGREVQVRPPKWGRLIAEANATTNA